MDAAARRLAAEDEAFLQFEGKLEGGGGGSEGSGGGPLGRVGLGRAFRLTRWTAGGACVEAGGAGYQDVSGV